MSLDLASLEHTLSSISREVDDVFADFSIIFILYDPGQKKEALTSKVNLIAEKTNNEDFVQHLETQPEATIFKSTSRPFPYFFSKDHYVSVVFIDKDTVFSQRFNIFKDDTQAYFKFIAYQALWEGLSLYHSTKRVAGKTQRNTPREKLLSDTYAIITMELEGKTGTSQALQKRHAELCFSKETHHRPEHNPFPITLDSLKLVLRHIKDNERDLSVLKKAHEATAEISEIYDDIALEKWEKFAFKAQEMIWSDRTIDETLGAAAYSTEDPYIRSYASVIADLLTMDISPSKSGNAYNPFSNQEASETLHFKTAENLFTSLIDKALIEENASLFEQTAQTQNEKLLQLQIIGWCAPALVKAGEVFKNTNQDLKEAAPIVHKTFHEELNNTSWANLQKLHAHIILMMRDDETSLQNLRERIIKDDTLSYLANYF